jgi:hypothetical protein
LSVVRFFAFFIGDFFIFFIPHILHSPASCLGKDDNCHVF